ncbi:MAG: M1 family metallopeptidase [Bacteroidetes bacterium]|nr:M1 family metallopeptidase [Bacteroidota bacterium]
MKNSLLTLVSVLFFIFGQAQDLYIPRDVKEAYKKETRSPDGKPGKNYWQNTARYAITLTALPPNRTIQGEETIVYINNSPDSIRNPAIKLFLNIHKPGAPRNSGVSEDYLTSGMHIETVTFNGTPYAWKEAPFASTWQSMRLPKPLPPHDSMKITFKWHFEISKQSGREGMIDSTTYFLAYFYPRIAVLDDYNGWDRMNFMDSHEFYSDFNDYTVTINAPKNYVVWGTGTLQHPENLLQPEILQRFTHSFTSDQIVHVATLSELAQGKVTKQNTVNHWQFKAQNIPDMAFAISNHYLWDAGSVVVDNATQRRASVQAVYDEPSTDFKHMVKFGKHALHWFSRQWPGIPYPYEKTTIFRGFADMEYPMMVNDSSFPDTTFTRFVVEHELAHTYMPFYMGINETRYGFMDEGWATTLELLIGRTDMGAEKADEMYKQFRVMGWAKVQSSHQDIPITTPGDALTGAGFGNNEYGKASIGYLAMKDLLGDDAFKKCLHAYMDRWHGKHPTPWDFFFTFNDVSKKNLNWFWSNWFFSTNYIDLALKEVRQTQAGYLLTIENIGGMAAPFDVVITNEDGTTERTHQTPAIWEKDQKKTIVAVSTKKKIKSIALDGNIWMDADESNNKWTAK